MEEAGLPVPTASEAAYYLRKCAGGGTESTVALVALHSTAPDRFVANLGFQVYVRKANLRRNLRNFVGKTIK